MSFIGKISGKSGDSSPATEKKKGIKEAAEKSSNVETSGTSLSPPASPETKRSDKAMAAKAMRYSDDDIVQGPEIEPEGPIIKKYDKDGKLRLAENQYRWLSSKVKESTDEKGLEIYKKKESAIRKILKTVSIEYKNEVKILESYLDALGVTAGARTEKGLMPPIKTSPDPAARFQKLAPDRPRLQRAPLPRPLRTEAMVRNHRSCLVW